MNLAETEEDMASARRKFPIWAAILILIGFFALLSNLNIIPGLNWDIFWPVLLIMIGAIGFYEYYYRR
jgi:Mg2+ and Co2+ transporter CorA